MSASAPDQDSRRVIERVFDSYNAHDLEGFVELCDPSVELLSYFGSATTGDEYRGHEGVRQFLGDMSEAWEQLTSVADELVQLADGRILVLGSLQGVGRGSAIQLDQEAAWICTLRDGKLLRWESYRSREEARQAAGVS